LNKPNTLAIVEDDAVLREELSFFFIAQGFVVYEANSYQSLMEVLKLHDVQLVLLDLNLPGKNGYEISSILKSIWPKLGVVMLSARSALNDRVQGYNSGADIYLTKPTDPIELLATVRSLLKRLTGAAVTDDYLRLNLQSRCLTSSTAICEDLTDIEITVLRSLLINPQRTLDVGEIMYVLGEKFPGRSFTRRALENILSRMRIKLMTRFDRKLDPIKSLRGFGYQLTWDIEIVD